MDRSVYSNMAAVDQSHWWFKARRTIIRSFLQENAPKGETVRILEIGCGTGHNLPMLSEFGEVDAVELDDEARVLAERRLGKEIAKAPLPDLEGISRQHYQIVALLDVLEHIENDRAALRTVFECLAPGGKLLLTVPAHKWLWTVHDERHHHKRRYSKSGLRAVLLEAGFDVKTLTFFNFFLLPAVLAARLAGKITGKTTSDDAIPAPFINSTLERIFAFERHLVGRVPLPTGVSLLALASRN